MNENSSKRREWVKTAAIIFLSVLLVLTFFSSTIMNYSLPEVATQYVEPGTITAKIRGGGVVESSDPYEITVKETRKVASVAVRQGDAVQKGDVLVYLEEVESEELDAARKALDAAQERYDQAILSADVNEDVLKNIGGKVSISAYRKQISDAQGKIKELQDQVDAIDLQISITPSNAADTTEEQKNFQAAKTAKDNADFALADKQNQLAAVQSTLDLLQTQIAYAEQNTGEDDQEGQDRLEDLRRQKKAADQSLIDAQAAKDAAAKTASTAQLNYQIAQTALDNKTATGDTSKTVENLTIQRNMAQKNLSTAEKNLAKLVADINQTLSLDSLYSDITEAQAEVDKLEAKSLGGTVTAEVAGTIISINATAGKEISALQPVAVIQPEGKGHTMQFSVTNEQAKRLSVGDTADLVNSWRYDNVEVVLASIKPDPQNPGQQKQLTFDVAGNVTAGQTINVSVGQKSANYDLIVPNSAIREDNNGKFILIVETKSTPLNNRYIAARVDVEVIASDDTRSAINGALYGYEYVITTATAPIEAGKQVRLANN